MSGKYKFRLLQANNLESADGDLTRTEVVLEDVFGNTLHSFVYTGNLKEMVKNINLGMSLIPTTSASSGSLVRGGSK